MYSHYAVLVIGPQNGKTGFECKYMNVEKHYYITEKSKTELPITNKRIKILKSKEWFGRIHNVNMQVVLTSQEK